MKENKMVSFDTFYYNNKRKMAGLPLKRKTNKTKRYLTRNEPMEAMKAFLDYCNQ